MVVIGVGYFKLLLPDSERSIGINHHLRRGAVDLRPAETLSVRKMITRVQAVATVLALIPHRRDCRIWLVLVPW